MTESQHQHNQMTNSHILVDDFNYYEPGTVDETVTLLGSLEGKTNVMAGGTHLLTSMKMEREAPENILNISFIPELQNIVRNDDGELVIGAAVTIHDIRHNTMVRETYPALAEACAAFGSTQIQIMATLGGNLCNASPASDTVPALMIYDARVVLTGKAGERQLALKEFLLGPGKKDLHPGEFLTAVVLPDTPKGAVSAFVKISRVAADLAKASAAALMVRDGENIAQCRIAFGSVAPTVIRLEAAEALLAGKPFSEELLQKAAEAVSTGISPIDDIRSNAWYRRRLSLAMTVDLLNLVWGKSRGLNTLAGGPQAPQTPRVEHDESVSLAAGDVRHINLTVNGMKQSFQVNSRDLLLNILRDRMDLKGAKYGCGLGECGACTVLVDGVAMLSCLMLAVAADGRTIITVEGLQKPSGELDELQEAFIDEAAFQCGYCTPGFLMATKSLLHEIPHPSEEEIRDYLKGNRCRCTGYASIMRAVIKSVQNITE